MSDALSVRDARCRPRPRSTTAPRVSGVATNLARDHRVIGRRGADTSNTVGPAAAGDARSADSTATFSAVSLRAPPLDPHAVAQAHRHRVLRARRDVRHLGEQVRRAAAGARVSTALSVARVAHRHVDDRAAPRARRRPGPPGRRPRRAARSPAAAVRRGAWLLRDRGDRLAGDEHDGSPCGHVARDPRLPDAGHVEHLVAQRAPCRAAAAASPACAPTTASTWSTATTVPAPVDRAPAPGRARAPARRAAATRARRPATTRARDDQRPGGARGCDARAGALGEPRGRAGRTTTGGAHRAARSRRAPPAL